MNAHATREESIINTVLDLAEDRGVAGVTTAGLARRLQFTEAALYRYFPGKAAIVAAALKYLVERLYATMLLELMPEGVKQGQGLAFQIESHAQRFTLRKGLLLELLIYAAGGREEVLHAAGAGFLLEYSRKMERYFGELQRQRLTGSTVPSEELSRLWVCQLLGGFVRCRLTREPWSPVDQPGFQAFLAQILREPSAVAAS